MVFQCIVDSFNINAQFSDDTTLDISLRPFLLIKLLTFFCFISYFFENVAAAEIFCVQKKFSRDECLVSPTKATSLLRATSLLIVTLCHTASRMVKVTQCNETTFEKMVNFCRKRVLDEKQKGYVAVCGCYKFQFWTYSTRLQLFMLDFCRKP